MVRRIFLLMLACLPLVGEVNAGVIERILYPKQKPADPKTIKVLVAKDKQGVLLEVKGKYQLFDPNKNEYLSTRFIGKRKYMQATREGLRWGEQFPDLYQIQIVPEKHATTTMIDGIEYRGTIYVYSVEGMISVVNEVDIEDYVSSVLANQIDEQLPGEALAALAIAGRTLALYQAENPQSQFWAVEAGAEGYQGAAVIHPASPVESAINRTFHMVMSQANDNNVIAPVPSVWSTAGAKAQVNGMSSRITLNDAVELAKKGAHAADILMKAYPGVIIQLTHN